MKVLLHVKRIIDRIAGTLTPRGMLAAGAASALLVFLLGTLAFRWADDEPDPAPRRRGPEPARPKVPALPALHVPLREPPKAFPRNTYRPSRREGRVSGSIDLSSFSPGRDLIYVDDDRVWWESDNDRGDTEDDHSMHRAIERPFRRLVELVTAAGGRLKVQDAYRPTGVHSRRSLHKEGRALDLTCDELGLEELAKLCWAAGFDWVYHEAGGSGGSHVHVSVARDRTETPADAMNLAQAAAPEKSRKKN